MAELTPFEVQLEAELDAFELEIRRRIDAVAAAQNNPAVGPDYFRRPIGWSPRGTWQPPPPPPGAQQRAQRPPPVAGGAMEAALRLLGLAVGFDKAALRRAYRLAAANAHPDRGGTVAGFQAVKDAYECLYRVLLKF